MTNDVPAPRRPRRRRSRGSDDAWPARPLLTALWLPAAAVLLPVGGALGAFGPWLLAPALVLVITGLVGLITALCCLCPTGVLRRVALALVFGPVIAVPLLSMSTAQATVLTARGVAHSGTVTEVREIHGRTTSYRCAVRYADAPGRVRSVHCQAGDTVGEQVDVTEDPGGLVDPEFSAAAGAGRADLVLAGFLDVVLLAVATACALVGALVHRSRTRRRAAPTPGGPDAPLVGR
ncbi:hypothetical protein ACIRS1_38040 [Kitasatospora sp. NPDC101176]|uniref:hypothetical protein n=1 Tax=Kitasatospora sp. NPDC101176 TaxID=3364099 RepID=UPI00381B950F